ncbi:MAG: FAD-binding oxidoreductase, partial [Methylococcales bacterium]|nr:FAD-binding oxidoreductase [Methylococcales bacterium]
MKAVDFLIIGQGLAGSLLGFELIQRGFKIAILDNGVENASQIAAGLINPITGMRFVKSTHVKRLLPAAKAYYQQLEVFFQQQFYIEKPMLRLLNSKKLRENAQKRLEKGDYQPYLGNIVEYGCLTALEQKQTGYLLTRPLLARLKQFFIDCQCYQKILFDYKGLKISKKVSYKNINAQKIIFCEGYLAQENPWFSKLPFQLVKGEILTLENTLPLHDYLLNYGYWMIPLDDMYFRTGATFDREQIDTKITLEAKQILLDKLKGVLPQTINANVIQQHANVRPCTLDKQPFIGWHPRHPNIGIFNGFGAKGSLQIPYYCQQFSQNLSTNSPLSERVDI